MTRHEAVENLLVAMDTLRSHKVRSGLTILGIVIGVTSVITVASIIDGLNRFVQAKVDSLGSRTYFVSPCPPDRIPIVCRSKSASGSISIFLMPRTCAKVVRTSAPQQRLEPARFSSARLT